MLLIQILLPISAKRGRALLQRSQEVLSKKFGGVTCYSRAPAEGLWEEGESGRTIKDEVIVIEVMIESIDKAWWQNYRQTLEKDLQQEEIIIRALSFEKI